LDQVKEVGGLQLMMTLTNHLPDYGGMVQYVRWAAADDGQSVGPTNTWEEQNRVADMFYTYDKAKSYYNKFITNIINRYKSGPYSSLIHSWDMCNEPRCKGDSSGKIATWVHDTAALIKSMDPNTPLTVGSEGFFGNSTPDFFMANPYGDNEGCDFIKEFSSPYLDFACIHMYPDAWNIPQDKWASWSVGWVEAHMAAAQKYLPGLPLVLQEYNIKSSAQAERIAQFEGCRKLLKASASSSPCGPLVGNMVWMVAEPRYGDYDNYTIYPTSPPAVLAPLEQQGQDMAQIQPILAS